MSDSVSGFPLLQHHIPYLYLTIVIVYDNIQEVKKSQKRKKEIENE